VTASVVAGLLLTLTGIGVLTMVPAVRRVADLDLAEEAPAAHVGAPTNGPSPTVSLPALDPPGRSRAGQPAVPHDSVVPVVESITIKGMSRHYDEFAPASVTSTVPVLIVLHGRGVSAALEESRDGLVQLAQQGKAIVVYPVGYLQSWNAGSCCGPAYTAGVDDFAFVSSLIRQLAAEKNVGEVFLVGYSNGGRLAFHLACADARAVRAIVVVAAVPTGACAPGPPLSLLHLAGTLDPVAPYDATTQHRTPAGLLPPTVTETVASWRQRDGCSKQVETKTVGRLELKTWSHCSQGTMVRLGTYRGTGHVWPAGGPDTPSGGEVLWQFLTTPRKPAAPSHTVPVPGGTPGPKPSHVPDRSAGPAVT
jgi:polyhydroxybutyrate depolymerase